MTDYERGKHDALTAILTACAKQLGHDVKDGVTWVAIDPDAKAETVTLPGGTRVAINPPPVRDAPPSVRQIIWRSDESSGDAFRNGKWLGSVIKVRDDTVATVRWEARTRSLFGSKHLGYYPTEADARAVVEGSAGT